jgi:hypothetical protein
MPEQPKLDSRRYSLYVSVAEAAVPAGEVYDIT